MMVPSPAACGLLLLLALTFGVLAASADWGVKDVVTITSGKGGLRTPLYGKDDTPADGFGDRFGYRIKALGPLSEGGPTYLAVSAPYMYYYNLTGVDGTTEGAVIIMELNETGHVVFDYPYDYPLFEDPFDDKTICFGLGMEVVADWDGDERPELLVADMDDNIFGPGKVRWLRLDSEGMVTGNVTTLLTAGEGETPNFYAFGVSWTTLGDLNGDGFEDMAIANPTDGKIFILFFGANQQLVSVTTVSDPTDRSSPSLFGTSIVGLGDVDGDSVPDMAARVADGDDGLGMVLILMLTAAGDVKAWQELYLSDFVSEEEYLQQKNNGDTSFGHFVSTLGSVGWGVNIEERFASADWNHDGVPDLAISSFNLARVFLVFLNEDGTVKHHATIQGDEPGFGTAVAPLGDINSDGIPDLAVTNYFTEGEKGTVYIHLLDSLIVTIPEEPIITNETITFVVQLSASPQQDVTLNMEVLYEGDNEDVAFTSQPEGPIVFSSGTSELTIEVVITAINFAFEVSGDNARRQTESLAITFDQPTNAFFSPDFSLQLSFSGNVVVTQPDGNSDGSTSEEQGANKSSSDDGVGAEVIAPIVVVCVLVLLAAVAIASVVVVRRRMKNEQKKQAADLENGMEDVVYASPSGELAKPRSNRKKREQGGDGPTWEIDFDELEFQEEIGRGAFGVVWRAIWRDSEVAVKKLNGMDEHELDDFRAEVLVMKALRPHANVIQLYGVCSHERSPYCIVTEFMQMGNLLSYLREHPDSIDSSQMIQWAIDIAAGLRHLHQEGITHRDLAARNLLLTAQLNVKVSDFGLSRKRDGGQKGAQKTTTEVGPLKWMSPEAISELEYSEKSDVWSYGVCLWEIVTKGDEPFDGLNAVKAAIEICEKGTRLPIPKTAPTVLAEIITQCWSLSPQDRPTFTEIVARLKKTNH
ncbi:Tyrosine-protein kinase abl1 [Balamuthia mandrillaris]